MKSKEKISIGIVIPVFKTPTKYLDELLRSLTGELKEEDCVVWVDDGSCSGELDQWFTRNLGKDPHHFVIKLGNNRGISGAMNAGIYHLNHSEAIVTMGSDDLVYPGYLSSAKEKFSENPRVDILVPQIELFELQSGIVSPSRSALWLPRLFFRNFIPAGSMFRRSVWEGVGGFDEALLGNYEDWDFWVRAKFKGYKFDLLPSIGYRYRVRDDSSSRNVDFKINRQRLNQRWLKIALGFKSS